jgi:hypothetical protein
MSTASNSLLETADDHSLMKPERGSSRFVDRFPEPLVNLVTVLGFAIPILGYLLMVRGYSVNVVTGDQWDDVVMISHSYSHLFDWGSLWTQHNENRIFFPNLIVLVLARVTAFNIQVEEYLSFVLLAMSTVLFIWAHKRRTTAPWLYYCPVGILMFSVVQWENALWGFQMAWYLVLLCLASSLVLLDRIETSRISFTLAIVTAIVGSFSSLQGLLIWPAGLLIIWLRRRGWWSAGIWAVAAALTAIIYFYKFDVTSATPRHNYIWQHPITSAKFYLFMVGDVVGFHIPYRGPINGVVVLFGLAVTILAAFSLVIGYRSRVDGDGRPIGMALIVFGLMFAGIVTAGRVPLGYWEASSSRYTTFDLLILVGVYLTLLGPADARRRAQAGATLTAGSESPSRMKAFLGSLDRRGSTVAAWCLLPIMAIQIVFGLNYGLSGADSNHTYQLHAAGVLRTIDHQSDGTVSYYLYLFHSAPFIRNEAQVLKQHHLSLFAGP